MNPLIGKNIFKCLLWRQGTQPGTREVRGTSQSHKERRLTRGARPAIMFGIKKNIEARQCVSLITTSMQILVQNKAVEDVGHPHH